MISRNGKNGYDSVSTYYHTIDKYPVLSTDQEIDLALRIQDGDKSAEDTMTTHNLRLVANIARKYAIRRESGRFDPDDFLDLAQEGTLGLMKAVKRFDPNFNCTFATYAYYWIRQAITRAVANDISVKGAYRIPIHLYDEIKRLEKAITFYEVSKGGRLDEEELAELTGQSVKLVRKLMAERSRLSKISLNEILRDDNKSELLDFIPDPDEEKRRHTHYREIDLNEIFENALSILTPNERDIVVGRCIKEETLEQLGKKFRLSRERIRQLETPALRSVGEYVKLFYPEIAAEFIGAVN